MVIIHGESKGGKGREREREIGNHTEGSFILFMQSPAGWMCALLILVAMIATPILEVLFYHKKKQRIDLYWG